MTKADRVCLSCESNKTFVDEKKNRRMWYTFGSDWLCHTCFMLTYMRLWRQEHPLKYKRYQRKYQKTYDKGKPVKRKYQYKVRKETT